MAILPEDQHAARLPQNMTSVYYHNIDVADREDDTILDQEAPQRSYEHSYSDQYRQKYMPYLRIDKKSMESIHRSSTVVWNRDQSPLSVTNCRCLAATTSCAMDVYTTIQNRYFSDKIGEYGLSRLRMLVLDNITI